MRHAVHDDRPAAGHHIMQGFHHFRPVGQRQLDMIPRITEDRDQGNLKRHVAGSQQVRDPP